MSFEKNIFVEKANCFNGNIDIFYEIVYIFSAVLRCFSRLVSGFCLNCSRPFSVFFRIPDLFWIGFWICFWTFSRLVKTLAGPFPDIVQICSGFVFWIFRDFLDLFQTLPDFIRPCSDLFVFAYLFGIFSVFV